MSSPLSLLLKSLLLSITLPIFFILQLFFFQPIPAFAETDGPTAPSFNRLIDEGLIRYGIRTECQSHGRCSTTDILQVILNIGTFILGISGSVFLLMFIIGGFTWMLSGGNDTLIKTGLDTMRDAVIGLIIIFSAYMIVNTVISIVALGRIPTQSLESTLNDITGTTAPIQSQ